MSSLPRHLFTALSMAWILCAWPALGQSATQRLERLERDMQSMQRQLYRGGNPQSNTATEATGGTAAANLLVRITALEEQLRQLRGQGEENRYQSEQTARQLQLLQEDMEYRLTQIEQKIGLGLSAAPDTSVTPSTPSSAPAAGEVNTSEGSSATSGMPVTPVVEPNMTTPQSAKDLYNLAIGLMNKAQYAEASAAFKQFIAKYPQDKLLGNAYYWLGETFYVREDYLQAADQFRQGFETMPEGVKAPDNLLKLAMSLAKLDKKREACVVLQQIQIKYKAGPDTVLGRAARESENLSCQP